MGTYGERVLVVAFSIAAGACGGRERSHHGAAHGGTDPGGNPGVAASGSGAPSGGVGATGGAGDRPVMLPPFAAPPSVDCETEPLRTIAVPAVYGRALLSGNGRFAVFANVDDDFRKNSVVRWDVEDADIEVVAHAAGAVARAVSFDGTSILGRDDSGDFAWRAGVEMRLPFDLSSDDCAPLLSADGRRIAGCIGGAVVVVDIIDGTRWSLDDWPEDGVVGVPLALDGEGVVVAGYASSSPNGGGLGATRPFIWSTVTGVLALEPEERFGSGRAVALSRDGARGLLLDGSSARTWPETPEGPTGTSRDIMTIQGSVELPPRLMGPSEPTIAEWMVYRWYDGTSAVWYSPPFVSGVDARILEMSDDGTLAVCEVDQRTGYDLWRVEPSTATATLDPRRGLHSLSLDGKFVLGFRSCQAQTQLVRWELGSEAFERAPQ